MAGELAAGRGQIGARLLDLALQPVDVGVLVGVAERAVGGELRLEIVDPLLRRLLRREAGAGDALGADPLAHLIESATRPAEVVLLGAELHRDRLELAARAVDHLHVGADLLRQAADVVLLLDPQLVLEVGQPRLRRRDLLLRTSAEFSARSVWNFEFSSTKTEATRLATRWARAGIPVGVAEVEEVDAAGRVGTAVQADGRRHLDVLREVGPQRRRGLVGRLRLVRGSPRGSRGRARSG